MFHLFPAVTRRRVLSEFLRGCSVSSERLLAGELVSCSQCRQQVSPHVIAGGRCRACRSLRPLMADDPRLARILGEYPKLVRWSRWQLAETASVFGEMVVFEHLLREVGDAQARLGLLCSKVEDTIATVFRQVAMTRFEEKLHRARRQGGEVSRERICDLWLEANAALYGDAVRLTEGYRWWWAYIPHFVHSPFYCNWFTAHLQIRGVQGIRTKAL